MKWPLSERLASLSESSADLILDSFLEYAKEKSLALYPAQEEAILELFSGKNVILNTPTGSGKSLVAAALHFYSVAVGRRSVYTCPIKALVNEKFLALCRDFGPERVGMVTGDASVNAGAPILCCTAEILANMALQEGDETPIHDVIMDEFHYYSDRDRGLAWQIPLLTLRKSRFLLMSATLGETEFFQKSLTNLNKLETILVQSVERPVPLTFEYSEIPLHETISKLIAAERTPIYLVNFTQRECAEEAQNLLSVDFCTKEEKKKISNELEGVKFNSPYGKEAQKLLKHGVGIHHAGLLPKYRVLVEKLAQKGMLKVICGTDTLGVGVNVPIRSVVLTKLCKFDGERTAILSVRDFQQMSGRAGRKGFDTHGYVVVQAPAHIVENIRLEQKAAAEGKNARKIVKKKPPDKGYVAWNKETFLRLVNGQPEPLVSRFKVSHSMILQVLSRPNGSGCDAMRQLIRESHESDYAKKQHRKTAFQLFRSLVERKIIEFNPLRVNVDLQEDFTLNHALSLYLIDTIHLLDKESVDYPLDLLSLVESILENPEVILRKQLDRLKTQKMDEMKMEGIEYDQRIEELEKLEYPKPNRDFIYDTFNDFVKQHPWVGNDNIRPKSIVREMFENYQSFDEYIREYNLQRSEGILLRYLSDAYKALRQTVPELAKNDWVEEIEVYLRSMLDGIDSTLLDEWERLKNPDWIDKSLTQAEEDKNSGNSHLEENADIVRNRKAFLLHVRNQIFGRLRSLAKRDYQSFLDKLPVDGKISSASDLQGVMEHYFQDHSGILTDQNARNPKNTLVSDTEDPNVWKVQQILCDSDEHNDWSLTFLVNLDQSRIEKRPYLIFCDVSSL